MENGIGGFTPDGREYVVVLEGDRETPLPWSNVLANAEFGTMVSASGSAFTWAGNSRENRLTPFANDPISDPTGEAIYLRDEDIRRGVGRDAGPVAAAARQRPLGRPTCRRRDAVSARDRGARAGAGRLRRVDDPVKVPVLTLTNTSPVERRLSVFGYVEWCLGPPRAGERRFVDDRGRRGDRRDPRAQHLQHGVPRPRRLLSCDRARRRRTPAIAASSSAAIARSADRRRSFATA